VSAGVDQGIRTFTNHGCNGTNNIGTIDDLLDSTSSNDQLPTEDVDYSPFDIGFQRNYPFLGCDNALTLRDIQPEEELFDDYMSYAGDEYWDDNLAEVVAFCSGSFGLVSDVEHMIEQGKDEL
jgi:hypothetical protein